MYRSIVAARTRKVWRQINAGNFDAPVHMAADDLRFTFVGGTPLGASFVGRDQFREWFQGVFDRFPDVRFEVGTQIAEGDFVATRLHIHGHPVGDYGPVRSTDEIFDVEALVLFRLEDGRVAEEWLGI